MPDAMNTNPSTERVMLRHLLATLAYRAGKTTRDTPPAFADFRAFATTRTPVQILAHLGDLCDWALSMAKGEEVWHDTPPQDYNAELARFYTSLGALDEYLAGASPLQAPAERLIQGPIADAISHVGQVAMLRRIFGQPIRGENYSRADINAGQVGPRQPAPRREFD